MSAETCPTFWRSTPLMVKRVCFGSTTASMPAGNGNSIGCEKPRLNTTVFLPLSSARYPMPTISSSFAQPLVTPLTAFETSARTRPCSAACESFSRIALMCPSFVSSLMPLGMNASSLPFGPCTATVFPRTSTFTPCGTGIGFLPTRDMMQSFYLRVPHASLLTQRKFHGINHFGCPIQSSGFWTVGWGQRTLIDFAEHFAAHAFFARLATRHHALGRGEDVD